VVLDLPRGPFAFPDVEGMDAFLGALLELGVAFPNKLGAGPVGIGCTKFILACVLEIFVQISGKNFM